VSRPANQPANQSVNQSVNQPVNQPVDAPTGPASDRPEKPRRSPDVVSLVADLVAVAVFVALGRASHREGGVLVGYLATVWPFVAGAVVGAVAVRVARAGGRPLPPRSLRAGAVVLAATVVVGMTLRRLCTDGGTPVSFLLVATSFLALFLLGWRWAARRWTTRPWAGRATARPGR